MEPETLEGLRRQLDDAEANLLASVPADMEWSTHDNTEVFRWVLHNRALAIHGPAAETLIDDVPPLALRHEAAALAVSRLQRHRRRPGLSTQWVGPTA